MNISVVICAYTMDRWDALVAAVQSSLEQTLKPCDVIVVIDHNEDLLKRAFRDLSGAIVIPNRSKKGLSAARNTGIAAACGDVIAFLDDDAFAEPEWLEELTLPMSDPLVAGVGGWVLPHWEDHFAAWLPETFYWIIGCSYVGLPQTNARLRNPIGASMAIRRHVFTSVGGFTSGIGRVGRVPLGCEETELCIRYSSVNPQERFVLARNAIVHHRAPASRLTWHYFWTRCWAEGLSKAAVSSLVGSSSGLSAERRHLMRSLPRDFGRSLVSLPRHPRTASARIALILAGTTFAFAGLLRGRIALRRTPIQPDLSGLEIPQAPAGEAGPQSVAI